MRTLTTLIAVSSIVLLLAGANFFSQRYAVYVVPPFGVFTDGGTYIIDRTKGAPFIDGPRRQCQAMHSSVNEVCAAMSAVMQLTISRAHLNLPYFSFLEPK